MAYEETIRYEALRNVKQALTYQRENFKEPLAEEKLNNASILLGSAVAVLQYLDGDCPTCPYLDSLEEDDEEEDFCECGAGEDEGEGWPAALASFQRTITIGDHAPPDYDPDLGTYIVFCRN